MSLPPLPDIFGNYALGDFNEVVSPPGVDWLPQTPGWYVVGVLLLGWLGYRAWRALLHWQRNRYRGEALRKLEVLATGPDLTAAVNRVLKLSAMAAFTRPQVASLSGAAWPDFLNAACEQPVFDGESSAWLALGVYREDPLDEAAAQRLLAAAERWLREHRNRFDA